MHDIARRKFYICTSGSNAEYFHSNQEREEHGYPWEACRLQSSRFQRESKGASPDCGWLTASPEGSDRQAHAVPAHLLAIQNSPSASIDILCVRRWRSELLHRST